jgi:hypothetical protein
MRAHASEHTASILRVENQLSKKPELQQVVRAKHLQQDDFFLGSLYNLKMEVACSTETRGPHTDSMALHSRRWQHL